MKRVLLKSQPFVRSAKKMLRKKPHLAADIHEALSLLGEDANHASLRTHKLAGTLHGSWACSAGYDIRIIFSFVKHEGKDAILLETVGTHDEVY